MDSDPLISHVIGNYRIEARLGRGGMSTVYRARQLTMQRDVAIKMMSAELATDPQFISRFEREAQVIANLEHPRILPVHDYGHEGEYFYLVMRLVDGESLRDRLLGGALSLATAAHLTEQIASALDYAHGRGVIHRDLKPNNVLIDKLDNAYLMDFGIAKLMAASQQLTATGMVMGTPAYMAPEQWRGEPVDVRTDVYSLGVMLYEMVLGCQPFEAADTPFTLMYKHLNDAPPAPRGLLPDLPEAVERTILKALAKDPADRFQSAGALAAAFSEAAEQAGTAAHITPPPRSEPGPEPDADALVPVPLPDKIAPPPAPIPVPGAPVPPLADWTDDESQQEAAGKRKRKRKAKPSAHSTDLPESVPPVVREVVEWAAEKMEHVSIPGFVAPAEDDEAAPPALLTDSNQWEIPANAPAVRAIAQALGTGEQIAGVLYLRGTANWRDWRRLLIAGIILSFIGGIFNLWFFNVVGSLCWLYLLIQGFRTWRGSTGHYYVGFTPQRVIVLPVSPGGRPDYDASEWAEWHTIHRLRLTDEYLWLEASGSGAVAFLGYLPQYGHGGLDRQRKWVLNSPLAALVRQKGFYVKR